MVVMVDLAAVWERCVGLLEDEQDPGRLRQVVLLPCGSKRLQVRHPLLACRGKGVEMCGHVDTSEVAVFCFRGEQKRLAAYVYMT